MRRMIWLAPILFLISACPGVERGCTSCMAKEFGADWVVVELTEAGGKPYRCWELRGASVENERASDGIYWKDTVSDNLVHVSGSYDYVQVVGGDWDSAYAELNLTKDACAKIRARRFDPETNEYVNPETD